MYLNLEIQAFLLRGSDSQVGFWRLCLLLIPLQTHSPPFFAQEADLCCGRYCNMPPRFHFRNEGIILSAAGRQALDISPFRGLHLLEKLPPVSNDWSLPGYKNQSHLTPSWEKSVISVAQLCPTLCDPMGCSMPSFPVHHQLPELAQTHVHWIGDAIQPSHPLSSPSPPAFNIGQHQGLFQRVSSSHQVAKILEFQLQHQSFQWILKTDLL